jgi:hypothetical protein
MDQLGFIHEKLDIKILILYVLRRLPGTVEPETLRGLVMCDDGIGYFDYSDCLSELVTGGNVEEKDGGYAVTEKGARNADAVESSLPYSVRSKALRLLAPVEEQMRRAAMLTARHTVNEDGCVVELAMEDGKGEVMHLKLLCSGEEQARGIEKRFRKDAEGVYQRVMELLCE